MNRKQAFEGWCGAPATRPLVVTTHDAFRDPAAWKPSQSSPSVSDRIFDSFKSKVGEVPACPPDSEPAGKIHHSAADLVFLNGYADRAGRQLVPVSLRPELNACDGIRGDAFSPNWFLIADDVVHLGDGLSLADAGDYDADGHSEVLFWYSGYNSDGYVLFLDEFRNRAEYLWSCH
jgi:hypothetical protein